MVTELQGKKEEQNVTAQRALREATKMDKAYASETVEEGRLSQSPPSSIPIVTEERQKAHWGTE